MNILYKVIIRREKKKKFNEITTIVPTNAKENGAHSQFVSFSMRL